ncbi:MAG: hypothetical protein FP820_05985 [Sulfurimonas sp.]|jgi:hypothetical protein|nr:hypothetical protein [Sulfurimonas sp.]MBU1216857.1 hypothetical protein [bacterium]MBU1434984.1 hypothetical protein [bacterium]MBU1504089.1 hypothetical protein [bacterium]MBU3938560.1 hypothetical protein [bacterium]
MKIAVECQSPLLQKSLEIFLARFLSSVKHCDIVVRDTECLNDEKCFYIAGSEKADLKKPFSKSQLILALENKYESMGYSDRVAEKEPIEKDEPVNFDILERRIELLTKEYQHNIINAIKAFYEK